MDRTLHVGGEPFINAMMEIFNALSWNRMVRVHNTTQLGLYATLDIELTVTEQIELGRRHWNIDSIHPSFNSFHERDLAAARIHALAEKRLTEIHCEDRIDLLLTTALTQRGYAGLWMGGLPDEPAVADYVHNWQYNAARRNWQSDLMAYIRDTKPELETLKIADEDLTGTTHDVVQFIIENWPHWQDAASDIHDMVHHGEKKSKLLKRLGLTKTDCWDWAGTALIVACY